MDIPVSLADFDDSFDFPQPLTLSHRYPCGFSLSANAETNSESLRWFKRGDNHLQIYRAQRLLNCYIGGHFGAEWLTDGGSPWPFLTEHGMFDLDTQLALLRFQSLSSLPNSGCLCPRTRMLLPPMMRLRGSLLLSRPGKIPCLRWSSTSSGSAGRGASSSPPTKPTSGANPPSKPAAPKDATSPSGGSGPSGSGSADGDDDDKPWTFHLEPSVGVGATGPLWTGRSRTGARVAPDTLEVDQKTEVDLTVPTSLALGKGKLKLSLGAEFDVPVDQAHKGQYTLQGTLQLQADDFVKFGEWGSLSPFVAGSSQWQKGSNKWKQATTIKGGAELDINVGKMLKLPGPLKDVKVTGDVNSGVQIAGPGNDPATTATVVVPFEGNLKLQGSF